VYISLEYIGCMSTLDLRGRKIEPRRESTASLVLGGVSLLVLAWIILIAIPVAIGY
jgi:hypothetical protein